MITLVANARPDFMKIATIIRAIQKAQSNGNSIDSDWCTPANIMTKK